MFFQEVLLVQWLCTPTTDPATRVRYPAGIRVWFLSGLFIALGLHRNSTNDIIYGFLLHLHTHTHQRTILAARLVFYFIYLWFSSHSFIHFDTNSLKYFARETYKYETKDCEKRETETVDLTRAPSSGIYSIWRRKRCCYCLTKISENGSHFYLDIFSLNFEPPGYNTVWRSKRYRALGTRCDRKKTFLIVYKLDSCDDVNIQYT
jgi:hypothetical protein